MSIVSNVYNDAFINRAETCYGPCADTVVSVNLILKPKDCMEPANCDKGWSICVNQEKCYEDGCGCKKDYYEDKCCCKEDKPWRHRDSDCCCKSKYISAPGFLVDVLDIKKLYRETIGDRWDYKTLVQCGGEAKETPYPIEYVEFSPSTENMAIYVYDTMKPVLECKLNVILLEVEIVSQNGKTWYSRPEYEEC